MESEQSSDESWCYKDADEGSADLESYWVITLQLMAVLHPVSPLLRPGGMRASKSTAWVANLGDESTTESFVESSEDSSVHDPLRHESEQLALQRDCNTWLKRRHAALAEMFRRFDQGFPHPAWLRALQEEIRELPRDIDFERRVNKLHAIYGLCLVFGLCGVTPARLRCAKDGLVRAAMRELEEIRLEFETASMRLPAAGYRVDMERLRDEATARIEKWIEHRARLMRAQTDRNEQMTSLARARARLRGYLPPLPSSSSSDST